MFLRKINREEAGGVFLDLVIKHGWHFSFFFCPGGGRVV